MKFSKATFEDGVELANNLTDDDLGEAEAIGYALEHLPYDTANSEHSIVLRDRDGELAGIIGVNRDVRDRGVIWLLSTNRISNVSLGTIRRAREWTYSLPYTMLWNYADIRNKVHHRLFSFAGFQVLRTVKINDNHFYEIVKLCASP